MPGRRLLGFPPDVPFVNYQKHDAVKEKQEVLLKWAQEIGTQLPRAGEQVTELMDLYKKAVQLRAQQPRKQVRLAAADAHLTALCVWL
jgi:hypothetical protein